MVSLLFEGRVVDPEERLLDPGCGDGAFMKGVLRWSSAARSGLPGITGIELDSQLALDAASRFQSNPRVNVIEGDFLRAKSSWKYHYIIGNPPYVSILLLDEREKAEYRALYRTATGRFDLYMLFFERALEVLEPGGRLVFVTPEKFTYVDSATSLRALLATHNVRKLELLPEDTFGGLVTYPLVTVVEKVAPGRTTRIVNREGAEKDVLLPCGGTSWGPLVNGLSQHLKHDGMEDTLSSICERVSCGIATGADRVFVFKRDELPANLHPYARPTVAGRDLDASRPYVEPHSVMLIPYRVDGALIPLENLGPFGEYLIEPEIHARLLKRTCARRKPWYAFHETPPMSQIMRPKILCKDIAQRPSFWLDRSGTTLPRHSTYYIVPRDESVIEPLCEYLNGKHAQEWLVENCQRAANGFIRTQSNALKRLPIPSEFVTDTLSPPASILNLRPQDSRPSLLEMVA